MHMVINIYLDLLIGTWIHINNFIMKTIMWLFIDLKTHRIELLKLKNIK
jgi:hypothetical protein